MEEFPTDFQADELLPIGEDASTRPVIWSIWPTAPSRQYGDGVFFAGRILLCAHDQELKRRSATFCGVFHRRGGEMWNAILDILKEKRPRGGRALAL
jgi:hypothetical protein